MPHSETKLHRRSKFVYSIPQVNMHGSKSDLVVSKASLRKMAVLK